MKIQYREIKNYVYRAVKTSESRRRTVTTKQEALIAVKAYARGHISFKSFVMRDMWLDFAFKEEDDVAEAAIRTFKKQSSFFEQEKNQHSYNSWAYSDCVRIIEVCTAMIRCLEKNKSNFNNYVAWLEINEKLKKEMKAQNVK